MKTLEEVLARVKQQTAKQERASDAKKLEARIELAKRKSRPTTIYEREDLWLPVAVHREYAVQHCDCCKTEITVFSHQKTELRHKIDRSARKWRYDKGEAAGDLPLNISFIEHVVPECFCCYSLGRFSTSLWKGKIHETYKATESCKDRGTSSEHGEPSDRSETASGATSDTSASQEVGRQDS